MEFQSQKLIIFLALAFVGSYAAVPSEIYWNTVLPNTPMPKAIKDLLPSSDVVEDKSTSVGVTGDGVHVNIPGGTNVNVGHGGGSGGGGVDVNTPGGTNVNVGHPGGGGVHVDTPRGTNVNVGHGGGGGGGVNTLGGTDVNVGHPGSDGVHVDTPGGTNVNVGHGGGGGVGVDVNTPGGTNVNVGHGGGGGGGNKQGGANVNVGHGGGVTVISGHHHHKGKPVNVGVVPGPTPFIYTYAATKDQLHDNPNVALFFLENNLTRGANMNLHFFKTSNGATFLPRQVAESIPFSSNKVAAIFNKFSVNSDSQEAQTMKSTIKECEESGIEGEDKFCATSLEAMVDFSTSKLGKNIQALSTNAMKKSPKQKYTISGVKKITDDKAVACHQLNYAYAVFYCHKTHPTRVYVVSMVGADGTNVKAAAVCHEDTTKWNPNHLAFHVLKIKPGHVPVCHFLPEDHIIWAPK